MVNRSLISKRLPSTVKREIDESFRIVGDIAVRVRQFSSSRKVFSLGHFAISLDIKET